MHQAVGELARVGEQQQARGVEVQPADRDPLAAARSRAACRTPSGGLPGRARVTISPSGLWYRRTRGCAPAAFERHRLAVQSTRSPARGAVAELGRPAVDRHAGRRRSRSRSRGASRGPPPRAASAGVSEASGGGGGFVGGFGAADCGAGRGLKLQRLGDLLERRQFLQRAQAEVVEEGPGGGVQRRPARRIAMADDVDPAAALQRLDDLRRHRHAADVLDVAARHRLAVGDDGQRLHHRARIARRLFRLQALDEGLELRPGLEAPAARQAAPAPPPRPLQSSRSSSSRRRRVSAPTRRRTGASGRPADSGSCDGEQRRLEDALFGFSRDSAWANLHVDRREALGLGDLDQRLARQLEQREEASPPAPPRRAPGRTARRTRARAAPAAGAGSPLMCSRTDSSSRDTRWCARHARPVQQRAPGLGQVVRVDVGQALGDRALDPDRDREHVAADLRQLVELLRRLLHAARTRAAAAPARRAGPPRSARPPAAAAAACAT